MRNFAKNPQLISLCLLFFLGLALIGCSDNSDSQQQAMQVASESEGSQSRGIQQAVRTGPELLISESLDALAGKKVGLVANHTSLLPDGSHLVDALLSNQIDLVRVYAPEHGFRGEADAGAKIKSGTDSKTGLPIISLYGKSRKPSAAQVNDLDIILFDIQDIGSRHYTYISTMSLVMEACAENNISFWVLDRPNPNGWYVDGPMMTSGHESFIGKHHVPIVHGMTIGEYATMVNEEGWVANGLKADLSVVQCEGYTHEMTWEETGLSWTPPSPNIPTEYAAYLYPAICWLEPTPVSVGRGTDSAFTLVGAPWYQPGMAARSETDLHSFYGLDMKLISFTPRSLPGKSTHPKFEDQACNGGIFINRVDGKQLFLAGIQLFSELYQQHTSTQPGKSFFRKGFSRWPGNTQFRQQIESRLSAEDIYQSWQAETDQFRTMRKKYLMY